MKSKKKLFILIPVAIILTAVLYNIVLAFLLNGSYYNTTGPRLFYSCGGESTTADRYELRNGSFRLVELNEEKKYYVLFNKIFMNDKVYEYKLNSDYLKFYYNGSLVWILYKEEEAALKASSSYVDVAANLRVQADEDGWLIKDKVLIGYFGDKKSVTIPKEVEIIDSDAFSADLGRAKKVTKVTIPGTVNTVRHRAFAFTNADTIVIKEGVKRLEGHTFMDSYMDKVYIPESIEYMDKAVLQTEEGQPDLKVYCVKGSYAAEILKNNPPYGKVEIIYK